MVTFHTPFRVGGDDFGFWHGSAEKLAIIGVSGGNGMRRTPVAGTTRAVRRINFGSGMRDPASGRFDISAGFSVNP